MAGSLKLVGPVALATAAGTNIYQGGNASALVYDVIRHIHVSNTTAIAHNFTLYIGLTGGSLIGTQIANAVNVPGNSYVDLVGMWKMVSTAFLTGSCDVAASLNITIATEQFVVPQ